MSKVLVAYNDSNEAKHAVKQAATLAKALSATVQVAFVVEPYVFPPDLYGSGAGQWTQNYEKWAEGVLATVKGELEGQGVKVQTTVVVGAPAAEVLQLAEQPDVDFIVLGSSSNRSAVSRAILGSVANRIVNLATKPVLIVR